MALSILHLDGYRGWGGGQTQSLGLARALVERGCGVRMIVQAGGELARRATGVAVEEAELRGFRGAISLPGLMRRIRQLRPDVVHAHDAASQALGVAAAHWAGIPVVATRRTQLPVRRGRFSKLQHEWCARVICVSEAVRRECAAAGIAGHRLAVIPDFVDCGSFAPRVAPPGRARCASIVAVGRLSAEKGHRVLVCAMREVVKAVPETRLRIYGEGPERTRLAGDIAAAGLGEQVMLAGFVADPREALAAAAVVAMPSLLEGLGAAALEAMAMAKPVVATDAGGLPESVLDGVTGMIVPRGDAAALARALVALLRDPERARRLGEAGRVRMLACFDRPRVVERVFSLYQEILAGGKGCRD